MRLNQAINTDEYIAHPGEPMDPGERKVYSLEEARDALWYWFAFGEYEDLKEDALTESEEDSLETYVRSALRVLCEAIGDHGNRLRSPDGPYCVLCWGDIKTKKESMKMIETQLKDKHQDTTNLIATVITDTPAVRVKPEEAAKIATHLYDILFSEERVTN